MSLEKILFVDRDGTLINEPADEQIDTLEKLELTDNVIPAMLELRNAGYKFVMVSNQDGLGSLANPEAVFQKVQAKMLNLFESQGITFKDVLMCPHLPKDNCLCRKPHLGLVRNYMKSKSVDWNCSIVVGDRDSDLALAENMGIRGYKLGSWKEIAAQILLLPRWGMVERKTNETRIQAEVNLDGNGASSLKSGIGFFDHLLEQFAKHSGMYVNLHVEGDLHVDEHHTIEDVALCLGEAIRQALGDKVGIERYGFVLPMDESRVQISLDLSDRPYFVFEGKFPQTKVGELSAEMVPHFFRSFSDALRSNLHIQVEGDNTHHMLEAMFKGVGRVVKIACARSGNELPSTKGVL